MSADEFWAATPGEIEARIAGWARRSTQEWERTAWLAAHLLNIEGKTLKKGQTMTADKLLGRESKTSKTRRRPLPKTKTRRETNE